MPVTITCEDFPLKQEDAEALWQATIAVRHYPDEAITVRCVSQAEMQQLNRQYRGKDTPTNVLTFSYPVSPKLPESSPQHDVPLCLAVAAEEAVARRLELPQYVALLLVHAYLHITGLDHEKSSADAAATHNFEQAILKECGRTAATL